MLLLDIDCSGEPLTQGFVRARWPAGELGSAGQAANWVRLYLRSAMLWSQVRPLSAALRLFVRPGEPLTSVHSFVVPADQQQRLRLVLAAFLRTTGIGNGDTEVPLQQGDLPGHFIHPDEARIAIQYEKLQTGAGLAIHFNLRLADELPRLMQTLVDLGVPAAYEVQITPWSPPRDLLRAVLYDTARLEEARSAPRELVLDQRALAERLKRSAQQQPAYHVEECLATPPASAEALRETVQNSLSETIYGSFGAPPQLIPVRAEQAEAFAYHVHSHVMHGPPAAAGAESIAAAATKAEADRLLSCGALIPKGGSGGGGEPPGAEPIFLTLSGPTGPPFGSGPAGQQPASPAGQPPYLFISYARTDGDAVYPLIENLVSRGVSMWMDRRLLGGEDWVSELESRLINCAGVLAFVSPAFAGSKYCARELHFADALNRPILPIMLAPVAEMGRGLKFLMSTLQIIDFHRSRSLDEIVVSIRRHAPAVAPGEA